MRASKWYSVTNSFLLVAPADEQSNLSSHNGICLFACGQIDFLCKKLAPGGSLLKDTPQEVLKDTLET